MKEYLVRLTKAEINALFETAGQMQNDLSYYDFKGPKRSEKFRNAYESSMYKLKKYLVK